MKIELELDGSEELDYLAEVLNRQIDDMRKTLNEMNRVTLELKAKMN